ncbi:RAS p21 protein activator 2 [Salmo salar]|uniref:RAS p21 protein activator 2 n=1 Tax=Salmo salar TaxID=8030 RepID=B5X5Y5_SALSA|nr:RAS p21 protein activator 2 [Salmo salar]ACI66255.1 Ras GTPase-activating protein 2 [Salmo salar]|eukprot:NP_001135301.1 RAS p21 protein activator 2 [Salmo salar]
MAFCASLKRFPVWLFFSPFYGEDFYFEIPRPFQCLSFYVFAKGVFQRDLPVGKVSIRKEELCKFSGKEHWFGLQPVDPNSEVQVGVSQTVFRHLYVYPVGLGRKVHLLVIVLVLVCGHSATIRLSNGIDCS